jgi:Poly(ADP-ribose) polymerase catalytic domain
MDPELRTACAGKGIYLASELCKSAGYTQCGTLKGKSVGVLFLAEAALGKEHGIVRDDPSLVAPPKGGTCSSLIPVGILFCTGYRTCPGSCSCCCQGHGDLQLNA